MYLTSSDASRPSLGAPAVRRSPSARTQAAYNTVYRSTLGAPADQPLPCAGIPALRFMLPSCHMSHNTSHHDRLRPFPRRLRAKPKISGRLSDARLDKPRFMLKAQVLQKALPLPLPWLAHLCSPTHTLRPSLIIYVPTIIRSLVVLTVTLLFFLSRLGVRRA